jgi:hypothetical protein
MDDLLTHAQTILGMTSGRWAGLTGRISPELLSRQPSPGQWSALECLQHLVDTEPIFSTRVRAFLAGQDFPAFDPDSQGTLLDAGRPPVELARTFANLREESLAALSQLGPADLGRKVRHQELGPVTLGEMIHEWAAHDLMHTVQGERALMQPFISGSGPWQPYFADHVAKELK